VTLTPKDWFHAYERAWVTADSAAAAALFADDGVYCWDLLEPPAVGRAAIKRYWDGETARQSEVEVQFGREIASDGGRIAVEFWTRMREHGQEVTLYGCMLLRFDDLGLCRELREYWLTKPGRQTAPAIWGR
jgi:ketosteroid isomerase-like protein